MSSSSYFSSDFNKHLFTGVKYLVYVLLCLNVLLFLQKELAALNHTFVDGFELGQFIQVFSSTIDTAAWVVLLILFELETSVLEDRHIKGAVESVLHGVRGLCYVIIVYAFTGYYAELVMLYHVIPQSSADTCLLVQQDYSLLLKLDEYVSLSATNCAETGNEFVRLEGFRILAETNLLHSARWLAWTDVVNSAAWILVCMLLELEVRLQLRGNLSDKLLRLGQLVKLVLYTVLFAAAIYWGVAGDFLDFWDAALWLFAFLFVEMNVFEWRYEIRHPAVSGT